MKNISKIKTSVFLGLLGSATWVSAAVLTVNIQDHTSYQFSPAPWGFSNEDCDYSKQQIVCRTDSNKNVFAQNVWIIGNFRDGPVVTLTSTPDKNGENFHDEAYSAFDNLHNTWVNIQTAWSQHQWDGKSDLTVDLVITNK